MIKFLVMDVDGTLTDGKVYMGPEGEPFKAFDVKDGYATRFILPEEDIIPIIITARESKSLVNRCKEMHIYYLYQGIINKLDKLKEIISEYNKKNNTIYNLSNVAYIGDDLLDLQCIKPITKAGGITACPADAVKEVKENCNFICLKNGGDGAVREFCEHLCQKNNDVGKKVRDAINYLLAMNKDNLKCGVYNVNGDFFYKVIEYDTISKENCVYEAHKKYVDIQYIIEGIEQININNSNLMEPICNYDEEKDIVSFKYIEENTCVILCKGSFVVLYPKDAHCGCLEVNDTSHVKKIIGKVRIK